MALRLIDRHPTGRRSSGPLPHTDRGWCLPQFTAVLAQVAERIAALRGLDVASGAVRAAVEGSAGRALRHERDKGALRNPRKAGRSVLWEIAG